MSQDTEKAKAKFLRLMKARDYALIDDACFQAGITFEDVQGWLLTDKLFRSALLAIMMAQDITLLLNASDLLKSVGGDESKLSPDGREAIRETKHLWFNVIPMCDPEGYQKVAEIMGWDRTEQAAMDAAN